MAVAHAQPDRPPIQVYLTPEVEASLRAHFQDRTIEEALEIDFRAVGPAGGPKVKTPEPGSGISWYDSFGVGYSCVKNSAGGKYYEATDRALARITTMDEVRSYPWPRADSYDYSVTPAEIERVRDYAVCVGGAHVPDIINGVSVGREGWSRC